MTSLLCSRSQQALSITTPRVRAFIHGILHNSREAYACTQGVCFVQVCSLIILQTKRNSSLKGEKCPIVLLYHEGYVPYSIHPWEGFLCLSLVFWPWDFMLSKRQGPHESPARAWTAGTSLNQSPLGTSSSMCPSTSTSFSLSFSCSAGLWPLSAWGE